MSLLDDAIKLAVDAHRGQKDRAGQPYILHPLRVMAGMETEHERIVAVLHDVVEDTPVAHSRIYGMFGALVGEAVEAITKISGERYDHYLVRVKANPVATRVKLADLRDNSDMNRLTQATDTDWERWDKYQHAVAFLLGAKSKFDREVISLK
jgi:(p)ppGpp synthase/HD superfamily hydrolase